MITDESSLNIISTIKTIAQKLENKNIQWVVTTSCALILQGIKLDPQDIDILTNKEDSIKINQILNDYKIKEFKNMTSNIFDSTLNKFLINNCIVEVMGNFNVKSRFDGKWHDLSYMLKNPNIVEIEKVRIPVLSILQSMGMYQMMGRKKDLTKVKEIEQYLKQKIFNY